jgi:hypothetical protein
MKVLFLGAGASISAGYPVTSDLLSAVLADAGRSPEVSAKQAFADWNDLLARAESLGLDRQILGCPNPEIPLSYLDLWAQAADEAPDHFMREAIRTGRADPTSLEQWRTERAAIMGRARRAMRRMLDVYFMWKGYLDRDPANRTKRDYLRSLFSKLTPGDVIVTLNWDTTAERTLAEDGRWSPVDGYGFRRQPARVQRRTGGGSKRFPVKSEVLVLKLHGSVGWNRDDFSADRIYLSNAYLLQDLPVTYGGEDWFFEEQGFNRHARPHALISPPLEALDPVLEIPSYLKQVPKGADAKHVWSRAESALARATDVDVWGYGLPESDGHIRLFLSGLPRRLRRGRVRIRVHNPDASACDRWRNFLGPRASVDRQRL